MHILSRLSLAVMAALTLNFFAYGSSDKVASSWITVSPIIARVSYETGIDVKLLAAMGAIESSFRTDAKNGSSSARGVYQFTKRTWRVTLASYGHLYGLTKHADVHDPYANALMAAEYIKENVRVMQKELSRLPTYDEIYMAHLLSPLRASALTQMPENTKLANIWPLIAKYNKRLFFDEHANPITVAQFRVLISNKVNNALHVYGKLANLALVKYRNGKIELSQLDEQSLPVFDIKTCPFDPKPSEAPIEIHFIGYQDETKVTRCPPKNGTPAHALSLIYVPRQEDEL